MMKTYSNPEVDLFQFSKNRIKLKTGNFGPVGSWKNFGGSVAGGTPGYPIGQVGKNTKFPISQRGIFQVVP